MRARRSGARTGGPDKIQDKKDIPALSETTSSTEKTPWLFVARLQFDIHRVSNSVALLDKLLEEYNKAPDEDLLERIASESVSLHNTIGEVQKSLRAGDQNGIVVIGGIFPNLAADLDRKEIRDLVFNLREHGLSDGGEAR